jgi:hypothetical protein
VSNSFVKIVQGKLGHCLGKYNHRTVKKGIIFSPITYILKGVVSLHGIVDNHFVGEAGTETVKEEISEK